MVEFKSTLPEYIRGFLGVFVVIASFGIIAMAWYLKGVAEAEGTAAIFAGSMGLVMGYYFGRTGVEKAQQSADDASTLAKNALEEFKNVSKDFNFEIEQSTDIETQLKEMTKEVEEYHTLLTEMGKDPVLVEKLKSIEVS